MKRSARVLPALLLVSGFCGISYEILYTKLLGNMLGNTFVISASVLLTFLLGIGLGTLFAHRFVRQLWAIEAGIGLYAVVMVLAHAWVDRLIYSGLPTLGTSMLASAAVSVVLLVVPAFLVGCSVPLFAAYLSTLRDTHVFAITYGVYNFGAALTAIAMEFVVLRAIGLRATMLWLAALNVLVAAGLIVLVRRRPMVPPPVLRRISFSVAELAALTLASVASAIFQLLMIRVVECLIGPFNETFALVLAVVLLGLALGSLVVGRFRLSLSGALVLALGGLLLLLLVHPSLTHVYAALYPRAVSTYPLLVLLKLSMVLAMVGLPAIGFGATIPALLREHRDVAREAGLLLFVSSMANVVGFMLMAFVLHRTMDYGPILLVVVTLTAAAAIVYTGLRDRRALVAAVMLLAALGAQRVTWDEAYLYFGHETFQATKWLDRALEREFVSERFKGYRDVFALNTVGGEMMFFINGYNSIPLNAAAEKVAGGLSVLFAPRTDDALVLGVGSGATAATVGLMFDRVVAVEINQVILDNLFRMREFNFDLETLPNVEIVHDDGIHYIKTIDQRYSLIVNTVTTPIYFSSSKLYTLDFLELVKARLTPDGVYTTWVDQDIGDKGVEIIFESLRRSFEHCAMSYLKSSYYLMSCSDRPLRPYQAEVVAGEPRLDAYFGEHEQSPSRLVRYSVLLDDAFALASPVEAPLNTLDFPVLEHEMAQLSHSDLDRVNRRLDEALDLRRLASAFEEHEPAWDAGEFAVWADLRLRSGSSLHDLLRKHLTTDVDLSGSRYAAAALRLAAETDTPESMCKIGRRLYRHRLYDEAEQLFRAALSRDPQAPRAEEYLERIAVRRREAVR